MLILVGVSVSIALNSGLFKAAQTAAKNTQEQASAENAISSGYVTVINSTTNKPEQVPISQYYGSSTGGGTTGGGSGDGDTVETGSENWTVTEAPADWGTISALVTPVKDASNNIIPLPNGFTILSTADTYADGVVITDANNNEFVWIPYTDTAEYTEDALGPTGEGYETYKEKIETSMNKYNGFYVGRYRTTCTGYDEDYQPVGIGVKSSDTAFKGEVKYTKDGTASLTEPTDYDEGGYELELTLSTTDYIELQKDKIKGEADINGNYPVGSFMITSKQFDFMKSINQVLNVSGVTITDGLNYVWRGKFTFNSSGEATSTYTSRGSLTGLLIRSNTSDPNWWRLAGVDLVNEKVSGAVPLGATSRLALYFN